MSDTPRSIPDPGFSGDDGSVSGRVAEALARYDADPVAGYPATLFALQDSRVLVPVVAMLGEVEYDDQGLAHDKTSDMATVLMTGADGRRALLAFTGSASLQAWDPAGRPVPVTLRDAARAARHDHADALLVDVAGPVLFVVEGEDLDSLADGQRLVDLGGRWGWTRLDDHPGHDPGRQGA